MKTSELIGFDQNKQVEFVLPDSEDLSRLLSDAGFEGIAIHDSGKVLAANSAFTALFGYEPSEIVGMDAIDFFTPQGADALTESLDSSDDEKFRAIGLRKDGSTFPAEVRLKTVVDNDGRDLRIVATRDLTDRITVEKALQELDDRLVRLTEGLPVAVLMFDATGMPLYANRLAEELVGRGLQGLGPNTRVGNLSEPFQIYRSGTDSLYPAEDSPLVHALAGETTSADDIEIRRPDGSRVPIEIAAAPIMDQQGDVSYAVAVFRNISMRRRAEAALRRAEEKYRNIFEEAVDGIFQSTPEGKFLTANRSMALIWGYESPEEMIARIDDISMLYVDPAKRDEFKKLLEENDTVQDFEAEITRPGGSSVWISVNARTVRGDDGSVLYYEGTIKDVTERRRADRRILDSEERYRTLVETSPDAIALIDFDLTIVAVNRQAAAMFGFENPDSITGTSVLDMLAPVDRARAFVEIYNLIQLDQIAVVEYNLRRRDEGHFPAEVSVAPVHGPDGRPAAFMTVVRDITKRKESEEAQRMANAELQGFAHTVSHDLKNPLSAISLACETLDLLVERPDSDETRTHIKDIAGTIGDSALRATALIGDLLALAEAGRSPKEVTRVDVNKVLRNVLEDMAPTIAEKKAKIKIDGRMGRLNANPAQVYQVFSNLIGNAVVHNDNPNPEIEVTNLSGDRPGGHRYRVKDNGSGIADSVLDTVFLPFSKGPNGQTGIGLAIVEKIVKIYHGEVRAYNDGGAIFEVTFREP
jgi:PAS domain S-box-containing protein